MLSVFSDSVTLPQDVCALIFDYLDYPMKRILPFVNQRFYYASFVDMDLFGSNFNFDSFDALPFFTIVIFAIEVDSLTLLDWVFCFNPTLSQLSPYQITQIHRAAVEFGRLEILIWFKKRGIHFQFDYDACSIAAERGHLDLVKWLHLDNEVALEVDESLSPVRDLLDYQVGFVKRQSNVCLSAAKGGHLEIIKWARNKGCSLGNRETFAAILGKTRRIDIIEWAWDFGGYHDNYTLFSLTSLSRYAAAYGNFHVLKWCLSKTNIWNSEILGFALIAGHLNILEFIHNEGFICTEASVASTAARHGHLDILIWQREHGGNWDESVCTLSKSHAHIQDWIHRNGCPCSCPRIS